MEIGMERRAALAFIITGLSHIVAPGAWVRLFTLLREKAKSEASSTPSFICRSAS